MLTTRVLSSAVMVPLALIAVWYGSVPFNVLVAIAAAIMAWEWGGLTRGAQTKSRPLLPAVIGFFAVIAVTIAGYASGLAVFAAGCLLLGFWPPGQEWVIRLWSLCGLAWIVLPSIALVWLRADPRAGGETVVWILASVWAVDTAAFAVGKTFGGPRLAPRISPSKTWSGLIGGVAAATAVGLVAEGLMGGHRWIEFAAIGAALAVIEQGGDLAESYAKRRFGVKDSGSLIPGHGGLLDRLDGMLAVIVAVVLLDRGLGESVLLWR